MNGGIVTSGAIASNSPAMSLAARLKQVHGNSSCLRWVIGVLVVSAMAGCGNYDQPARSSPAGHSAGNTALLEAYGVGERDALRIRLDAARNRLWVLGIDDVRVYDTKKKQLARRIALPGWSVGLSVCMPDLALDRSGSAFISSNIQPRLWRIDAESFEVKAHEISLHEREMWDTGFGAIVFGADGTLFALTSSAGSLWKIAIDKARARMIRLDVPVFKVCALAMPAESRPGPGYAVTTLCIDRDGSRRIEITSDLARGRVVNTPCNDGRRKDK